MANIVRKLVPNYQSSNYKFAYLILTAGFIALASAIAVDLFGCVGLD